ncbi:hypothetical protein Tco_0190496 [Tanacetum coccineum]
MIVRPLSVFSLAFISSFIIQQIEKNIEEAKSFVEDKDYAVKSAEDGTPDLKKTVKDLAKSLADYEKKLEVYVCTDKISGNEDKCLEDQLRDAKVTVGKAKGDEAVALEKKLDIIQKDENIEKGLKFLAYDEGRMESIQKEWMVESEVCADLLHDNINDPPVDRYSASPAALLGNADPNNAHTKERKATSWRMREFSSLKFPISFYTICTVWCETPAYTNALQLNHEIVCALDPAYDAAQTIMDMINSGNVKVEDDEPDTVS